MTLTRRRPVDSASPGWANAPAPDDEARRRRRRRVLTLCILLVFGFYLRCGWSYGKRLDPAPGLGDFQNLQADAFLAGQLHLTIPPPPGLTSLPDPFDPVANEAYRRSGLHDLTLYRGRLYTYFGPAPVILLYIPFRLLRVGDLAPTLAVLTFGFGGFLASVRLFRLLAARFLGPLSLPAEALATLALGLAVPTGWLIHIGRGYESSIACGYFLTFSGLYVLCRGLFGMPRRPVATLALGSCLLAAAVGARPNMFWLAGFLMFALAYLRWGDGPVRFHWRPVVALLVPYLGMAVLLAWYNWSRFGSVAEFGTNYMLLGENIRLARADELEFLWRGLFHSLLSPSVWREDFPWVGLRPMSFPLPTEKNYLLEPIAGLLPNMPASVGGIVLFCSVGVARLRRLPWLSALVALMAGTGFAIVALNSFHFHSATMRYQMDYSPLLAMASVLGWFVARRFAGAKYHRVLQAVAVVAVGWSAYFSIGITTYPCAGTGSC